MEYGSHRTFVAVSEVNICLQICRLSHSKQEGALLYLLLVDVGVETH